MGPPKLVGSWWRGLTECDPLKKGRAIHFRILALKFTWTVWKGKLIGYWKRNSPDEEVPNMLLEISGEITPDRMKGWSQSENNTQLWTLLLSPVTSTTGYWFCFGSIPSFFLELFFHWSPVAYWAPKDLGSSSFRSWNPYCQIQTYIEESRENH